MKSSFILLIITSLFLLSSCNRVVLRIAGMRMPKIENSESVEKFARRLQCTNDELVCIDSNLFESLRRTPFKPGWPPSFRPIQIRCYDKSGNPVMHWASCEGLFSELRTFDSVPPVNLRNLDSTLNLQQDLDRYFTLDGDKVRLSPDPGYDYYFIVYIARYFPKQSKTSCKAVSEYARQHPDLKMKVYLVDADAMDWWNQEIETSFKIKFH